MKLSYCYSSNDEQVALGTSVGKTADDNDTQVFDWKIPSASAATLKVPFGTEIVILLSLVPYNCFWCQVRVPLETQTLNLSPRNNVLVQTLESFSWIEIQYTAQRRYDPDYRGLLLHFTLLSISVHVHNYNALVTSLSRRNLHKLVAVVCLERRHASHDNCIPLGRAQSITTSELRGSRVYRWNTDPLHNSFPGVPRRTSFNSHVDELLDRNQLRANPHNEPLLSARHVQKQQAYEPDNDSYSSTHSVLPVHVDVGATQHVHFEFYNAYTRPAPCARCSVAIDVFLAQLRVSSTVQRLRRRGSFLQLSNSLDSDSDSECCIEVPVLETTAADAIKARIAFKSSSKDFEIVWIELHVEHYQLLLPEMQVPTRPKTHR